MIDEAMPIVNTFYYLLAIIPSIILHEVSHGYVANLCGDPTAKNAHRLTLNPLRHVDPFGTILLPFLLIATGLPAFGWAKPVPVNVVTPAQAPLAVALRVTRRAARPTSSSRPLPSSSCATRSTTPTPRLLINGNIASSPSWSTSAWST